MSSSAASTQSTPGSETAGGGALKSFRRRHPVAAFIVRRVAAGILTLLVASFLIFASIQILPGDVASVVLGKNATPARVEAVRSDLNLDDPLPQRYATFLGNVATGHFGNSSAALAQGRTLPVWDVIRTPLRNSLILAGITIALFVPLCLLLGTLSALRAGRAADHAISVPSLVASAMPEFLVGTILIVIFFTQLNLFPPVAEIGTGETPFSHPDALVLPVLTLLSVSLALGIRLVRASMLDVLRADYVRMARLNGQPERRVVTRYALRNALGPGHPGHRPDDAVPTRRDHHHRERLQLPGDRQQAGPSGIAARRAGDRRDRDDPRRDLHRHQHRRRPGGDPRGAEAEDEPVSGRLHMPRLTRTISGKIGIGVLVFVLAVALLGPLVSPHGIATPIGSPGTPPSDGAPLGTDYLGRDVLSRVLHGGLSVIWIGAAATLLAYAAGMTIGLIAGYQRSLIDPVLMRGVDVLLAFPALLVLLLLVAGLGSHVGVLILGVALVQLPPIARIIRTATLEVSTRGYIEAAQARGERTSAILRARSCRTSPPSSWRTSGSGSGSRSSSSRA